MTSATFATPTATRRRSRLAWLALAGLAVMALAAPAVHGEDEAEPKSEATYLKLHPDFVVNLQVEGKKQRYLLTTVQVMSHDPQLIERTKNHIPALRHRLLLLFSDQRYPDVNTADSQRELQSLALAEVNDFVKEELGKSHEIEGLFFTNFVVE